MKKSAQREGHLQLHSALFIGHKEKEGVQRVYSQPFAKKKNQGKRRTPPGPGVCASARPSDWRIQIVHRLSVVLQSSAPFFL